MSGIEAITILSIISCSASSAIAFYKTLKYIKKMSDREATFKEVIDDYVDFLTKNENNVLQSYALLGDWYINNSASTDTINDIDIYGNYDNYHKKDLTFFHTLKSNVNDLKSLHMDSPQDHIHDILAHSANAPSVNNINVIIHASNIALVIVSYLVIKLYTSKMESNKRRKLFEIYQRVQTNPRVAQIINREINSKNKTAGFDYVQTVLGLNMMYITESNEVDAYLNNLDKIINDIIVMNRIVNNQLDIINTPPENILFALNFLQALLSTSDNIIPIPILKNKKITEVVDIDFDRELFKLKLLYRLSRSLGSNDNDNFTKYIEGDLSIYVINQHKKTIKKYVLKKLLEIEPGFNAPEKVFALSKFIDILDPTKPNIDFKILRFATILAGKEPFLLTYPISKDNVDLMLTICADKLELTAPFMKSVINTKNEKQIGGDGIIGRPRSNAISHPINSGFDLNISGFTRDIFEPLYELPEDSSSDDRHASTHTNTMSNSQIFCIKKVYSIFTQFDTVIEIFKYVKRIQKINWAEFIKIYYGSVKNYDNVFKFISNYDNDNSTISFVHDMLFMYIIVFLFIYRNDSMLNIYKQIIITNKTTIDIEEQYRLIKLQMMRAKFPNIAIKNIDEIDSYKKYNELVDIIIKFHKLINCENSIVKFFIIKKNSIYHNQIITNSIPLYRTSDEKNAVLNIYYRTYMKSVIAPTANVQRKIKHLFDEDIPFSVPDEDSKNNDDNSQGTFYVSQANDFTQDLMDVLFKISQEKSNTTILPAYTNDIFTYDHFIFIAGLYLSAKLNVHCIESVDSSTVFHLDRFFVPENQLSNQLLYLLNKLMYYFDHSNELKQMYDEENSYKIDDKMFISTIKNYVTIQQNKNIKITPTIIIELFDLCSEQIIHCINQRVKLYSFDALQSNIKKTDVNDLLESYGTTDNAKKRMVTDILMSICNDIIEFDESAKIEFINLIPDSIVYKKSFNKLDMTQIQAGGYYKKYLKYKHKYQLLKN